MKIVSFYISHYFKEPVPVLKLLKTLVDMFSCIVDHWYYFARVGAYKWANKQEDYLLTCIASFTITISVTLDILNEFLILYTKKKLDKDYSISDHIKGKLVWLIGRLLDMPVRLPLKIII